MRLFTVTVAIAAAVACAQPQPSATAPAAAAPPFPGGALVDLSHTYDRTTVFWPTADAFRLDVVADGDTPDGYYYAANNFFSSEHGGTHLDAPVHFARGGQTVEQVPLDRLFGDAYVVDVTAQAAAEPRPSGERRGPAAGGSGAGPDSADGDSAAADGVLAALAGCGAVSRHRGARCRPPPVSSIFPVSTPTPRAVARGQPSGEGRGHRHGQHRPRSVVAVRGASHPLRPQHPGLREPDRPRSAAAARRPDRRPADEDWRRQRRAAAGGGDRAGRPCSGEATRDLQAGARVAGRGVHAAYTSVSGW